MYTKKVGSVTTYIKLINSITEKTNFILDTLHTNTAGPFPFSQRMVSEMEAETNEQIKRKQLSILFHEKYAYTREFEKHIQARTALKRFGKKPCFKFYYRGHYSSEYVLLPSAFRTSSEKEHYFYREIITRNPNEFAGASNLSKLVKMQHYGCPTRLLDITSNPLVALYFACHNTACHRCNNATEGEVLVFAPYEEDVLSFDSDKALILSCLPKFTLEEKKQIVDICINAIINEEKSLKENSADIIARLYHEIKKEFPAFKDAISPFDILSNFFVQPMRDNDRIIKQEGAFIICGQFYDSESLVQKLNSSLVARIKIINKPKILRQLDVLGINEATLFPEIDKVANYLKNR